MNMKMNTYLLTMALCLLAGMSYVKGSDEGSGDSFGSLHRAIADGNLDEVTRLITGGSDVNEKNVHGYTPLREAIIHNRLDIVRVLCEADATINVPCTRTNPYEQTPLHEAVCCGHLDIVRFLLAKGALVNATAHFKQTPLHKAIKPLDTDYDNCDPSENVNAADKYGHTALMYAAMHNNIEMARVLLENPFIEVEAVNSRGETALMIAKAKGFYDLATLLEERQRELMFS